MTEVLSAVWPTLSLFLLCCVVFVYLQRERPSWHALMAPASFGCSILSQNFYRFFEAEGLNFQYEVWATGISFQLTEYLCVLFLFLLFPPKKTDLLCQLLWLIVVIAEVWSVVGENINCNFWQTDIPLELQTLAEQEMSKCERIYGWWYTYISVAMQIAAMGYFARKYKLTKN